MSTPDNLPYSVAQQKAFISADLNSTLLYQFLFGIYTGVFPATLYIYVRKENRTRTRDTIIIGSTTALYFVTALTTVMNWLYTNILFGTHGATRVEMFLESARQDVPLGEEMIEDLTAFAVFLFADGLLVWRCFHACGQSFRRSLLAIVLLAVETVLALIAMVYSCLFDAKSNFQTDHNAEISTHLKAAALLTVATTSLVSTVVICLQIWRHTTLITRSRKRYRTIINALIESSALYTVIVLLMAVTDFTSTGRLENSLTLFLIANFVQAAAQIISGLAPTLMIAHLIVSSSEEEAEVSSARLPSDLISSASHATRVNMTNMSGTNLKIQQSGSTWMGEQESKEIMVVTRAEYQAEDELEDRLKTIV